MTEQRVRLQETQDQILCSDKRVKCVLKIHSRLCHLGKTAVWRK